MNSAPSATRRAASAPTAHGGPEARERLGIRAVDHQLEIHSHRRFRMPGSSARHCACHLRHPRRGGPVWAGQSGRAKNWIGPHIHIGEISTFSPERGAWIIC